MDSRASVKRERRVHDLDTPGKRTRRVERLVAAAKWAATESPLTFALVLNTLEIARRDAGGGRRGAR